MSFERVHRSRSQSPQTSSSTSQFAPRPFPAQEPKRPSTQEDIANEAFQQNKFEAFGLQLKEKSGTITPVEQERLGVLQAKMDGFWTQRMERAKAQPNLLEILIRNSQATQTTESQTSVQSSTIQAKSDTTGDRQKSSAELQPNKTGLPDNLKAGVENLSGYSLADVRVHYNSPKPSQLNALAYTQGTEIHVAPRQENHLPHEAWHVVQQKQGRVKPTMHLKGEININADSSLEKEADVMAAKAASVSGSSTAPLAQKHILNSEQSPVQGYWDEIYLMASELSIPVKALLIAAFTFGITWTINFVKECLNRGGDVEEEINAISSEKKKVDKEDESHTGIKGNKSREEESVSEGAKESSLKKDESLMQGIPGDCLYTAVSLAQGNGPGGGEEALRQIATNWLLQVNGEHEIFDYGDREAMIDVVSTPQAWTGDAGDLSAAVLAFSLGITLRVVTAGNIFVFNPGNAAVTIYYDANHYTSLPVQGVHVGEGKEIIGKPGEKVTSVRKEISSSEKSGEQKDSFQELTATGSGSAAKMKVDEETLSPEEVEHYRKLMRGLGNQAKWSPADKQIMPILRKAVNDEKLNREDRRKVDTYLKHLSSGKYLESPVESSESLSEADQFALKYPNAVRIKPLDKLKTALEGTNFADYQSFVTSTFHKPSKNLPKFDGYTVFHDTKGGSGGGFSIFGVMVGEDKFLIAHGHHSSGQHDYALDWVCKKGVSGWDEGGVSFKG